MITEEYIRKKTSVIEKRIKRCIEKEKYESALSLISICANAYYVTNIQYKSEFLEDSVHSISKALKINRFADADSYEADENIIVFFDGFGFNERGLIQIYLRALCKIKRVIYVTASDRKDFIPDVMDILHNNNGECFFLDRDRSNTNAIKALNEIIEKKRPGHFVFYSTPNDVVGNVLMHSYEGYFKRYLINLTDHAFWLGANCLDKCIEFRNYGANISYQYRGIAKEKIVIIPFYPIIHREKEFEGFPFEVGKNNKIVFSGGSLYKTFDKENTYYRMVEEILRRHEDVIFWYAGRGDSHKIKQIVSKYPKRTFYTSERKDLFQVLEKCRLYLSTYPLAGGLMFQYAASAGLVPLTLTNNDGSIDDILINQKNIGIEYGNIDDLLAEADKIINDDEYALKRKEIMKSAVISANKFESEVKKLFTNEMNFEYRFNHDFVDCESYRNIYLHRLKKSSFLASFANRKNLKSGMKYYPGFYLVGVFLKFLQVCKSV